MVDLVFVDEVALENCEGIEIKIVGRLVQQQNVGSLRKYSQQL